MDAGIFKNLLIQEQLPFSPLPQASPSLFFHLISTVLSLQGSTGSTVLQSVGEKKAPGGDLCKVWCYMRSIQEWEVTSYFGSMHGLEDWSQDGKKYLEVNFWRVQAQSYRNTRSSLENPKLKCHFSFSFSFLLLFSFTCTLLCWNI